MNWINLEKVDSSRRKVRNFGYLFGILAAVAAIYLVFKGKGGWVWCVAAGAFFVASGIFAQPVLRPIYIVWMKFAFILGWINTRIILGAFFYLVLTPIGLVMRLGGKDLLQTRIERTAKSYWIKRDQQPVDPKRLERMY